MESAKTANQDETVEWLKTLTASELEELLENIEEVKLTLIVKIYFMLLFYKLFTFYFLNRSHLQSTFVSPIIFIRNMIINFGVQICQIIHKSLE